MSTPQNQLGKLLVSDDGRIANLTLGPDPLLSQTTFTLIIYLAGSFTQGLKGVQQSNDKDIELEYLNGAKLLIDLEERDDLEYYKFRWSKPSDDILPNLWDRIYFGDPNRTKWYGGGYLNNQRFPIRHEMPIVYNMSAFVASDVMQGGASGQDRYWLSSRKIVLNIPWHVPLWTELKDGHLTLKSQTKDPDVEYYTENENRLRGSPYQLTRRNFLEYEIGLPKNVEQKMTLREFHLKAAKKYLKAPLRTPDKLIVEKPIWTTWAVFFTDINDTAVMDYATKITSNGFTVSQLELDDKWATEYGDFEVDKKKFPDLKGMIDRMKSIGVPRLTAWVHPFINEESKNGQDLSLRKFFIHDLNGNVSTVKWWQGNGYVTDFTNPEAREWYAGNLKRMQELGIYTFKFDAGEINFLPQKFALHDGIMPNDFSRKYADFASEFGPAVENRFGAMSQESSIFLRTMDRNSFWDEEGGLSTVIPWMLSLSLHGYYWNLPDMIGGNSYSPIPGELFKVHVPPDKELFIRWIQVNTLMMALQFSYAPFHYDQETMDISRAMLKLREKWLPYMLETIDKSLEIKEPPFRPVWWSSDSIEAYKCEDEFMVGDKLLVAPVMNKGSTSRSVFLPEGKWKDGNNGITYDGPKAVEVQAPISVLPHFERI